MQIHQPFAAWGLGIALMLGGMAPAAAQTAEVDSTYVLTLQEAVDMSYRQNPVMEAQRLAREAAVDRRKATWGLRMPQIGVAANYTYLSQDIKTNLLVQFDNDSGYVYYQRAEGLGVVSLKTKKVHIIPVKGRVAYIGTDNSNLTAVLSITGDGENIVSIYENPYYLLAETKFSCNDSYLISSLRIILIIK